MFLNFFSFFYPYPMSHFPIVMIHRTFLFIFHPSREFYFQRTFTIKFASSSTHWFGRICSFKGSKDAGLNQRRTRYIKYSHEYAQQAILCVEKSSRMVKKLKIFCNFFHHFRSSYLFDVIFGVGTFYLLNIFLLQFRIFLSFSSSFLPALYLWMWIVKKWHKFCLMSIGGWLHSVPVFCAIL